jgi:PTS system nitrogen regulatory IIA component
MNLKKILTPDTIWCDLRATTKEELIEEFIDRLFAAGKIKDREAALQAVRDREARMSTGMQNGVAIPHGKTDSVKGLVAAVGLQKKGIDFDSMDHQPSKIFIFTLSPINGSGPHMQFLAEVSRLLGNADSRKKLLACTTHQEMYDYLTGK